MLRLLETELTLPLAECATRLTGKKRRSFTVISKAAEPYLRALLERPGANAAYSRIPNDFFSHTIEVAGLLTAGYHPPSPG